MAKKKKINLRVGNHVEKKKVVVLGQEGALFWGLGGVLFLELVDVKDAGVVLWMLEEEEVVVVVFVEGLVVIADMENLVVVVEASFGMEEEVWQSFLEGLGFQSHFLLGH